MVGIGKLPEKERRKARRFNHIARDLRSGKYRLRVIPNKSRLTARKKHKEEWNEDQEND